MSRRKKRGVPRPEGEPKKPRSASAAPVEVEPAPAPPATAGRWDAELLEHARTGLAALRDRIADPKRDVAAVRGTRKRDDAVLRVIAGLERDLESLRG